MKSGVRIIRSLLARWNQRQDVVAARLVEEQGWQDRQFVRRSLDLGGQGNIATRRPNDLEFLCGLVPEHQQARFRAWAAEQMATMDIDEGFMGFIDDYVNLAEILRRHTVRMPPGHRLPVQSITWTVYDIGCAAGFQQVLFPFADAYVGIDSHCKPPRLMPNSTFIHGRFAEVVESLHIDRPRSFGIANMSLAYTGHADDLEAFDRAFLHKYIL